MFELFFFNYFFFFCYLCTTLVPLFQDFQIYKQIRGQYSNHLLLLKWNIRPFPCFQLQTQKRVFHCNLHLLYLLHIFLFFIVYFYYFKKKKIFLKDFTFLKNHLDDSFIQGLICQFSRKI